MADFHGGYKDRFQLLVFASSKRLSVCDLRVFGALLERFNPKHGECWPSVETIAKDTGVSMRQVSRSINRLEALELIDVLRSEGQVSRYMPNFDGVGDQPAGDF